MINFVFLYFIKYPIGYIIYPIEINNKSYLIVKIEN